MATIFYYNAIHNVFQISGHFLRFRPRTNLISLGDLGLILAKGFSLEILYLNSKKDKEKKPYNLIF
jgi:hypothetical protein